MGNVKEYNSSTTQKQISKLYDALSFPNDILITCFTSASMYGKYSQSKISTWLGFKH